MYANSSQSIEDSKKVGVASPARCGSCLHCGGAVALPSVHKGQGISSGCPAGNLAFPLLLVGGLFLLSRRQGGGMGGPGGNNPLNFAKSKAKFQMEPNTGITFSDVAGVDEAKQDFMEVSLGHCWASTRL